MATLESLQAKIQKLQAQAEALSAKKSSAVIEKIKNLMAEHGLTTADIDAHTGGKKRGPKPGAQAAAKAGSAVANYRDPKTGATWSGRGRAPRWIATAKNRDKFLVVGTAATPKPASASKAKTAGNYVRGPQPALYRDPKTGATWSGRGRAPAWIANVKDRSKFLIAGGGQATVAVTQGTAGKTKPAGKKTAKVASRAKAVGNYVRGPQPALYRDPKTGATWSGRARAPAWIANAKDRSKFLIDGATAGDKKPVATKAAGKKAPAAKETAAKKPVGGKVPANKASAKKASAKAAPQKSVTVSPPVATVESRAESAT
ncbi:H-NS family nucleoid-associated regulatory protein [Paraburkholderia caledonica]|jgi:DNA-binding protein H-NS|uniref:H-NS family nucleoid-associated regulatory protein n=1 Tax=Paraburkholderia caledonica TaxID=134536 RepID=UPI0038BD1C11